MRTFLFLLLSRKVILNVFFSFVFFFPSSQLFARLTMVRGKRWKVEHVAMLRNLFVPIHLYTHIHLIYIDSPHRWHMDGDIE